MITPEQIPDEVVEAARRAYYAEKPCGFRESIAAALNAWEGGYEMDGGCGSMECEERGLRLILPLPKEPRT
jgi:hypothetical protein